MSSERAASRGSLELAEASDPRPPKRRKVRKGALSCWECKRRKVKCSLAETRDLGVCDGCRRRGTRCVGQEYDDAEESHQQQVGDRLGRIEELLSHLHQELRSRPQEVPGYLSARSRRTAAYNSSEHGMLIRSETHSVEAPKSRAPPSSLTQPATTQLETSELAEVSQHLMSAWPRPEDVQVLAKAPMNASSVFRGIICTSYKDFESCPLPTPRELLSSPPTTAHPLVIARKLLSLALYLQSFSPEAEDYCLTRLPGTSSKSKIMREAFNVAVRHATTNDMITGNIEGLECILMESAYLNNAGQLRSAYLAIRRAVVISQMIGLDRGLDTSHFRVIDSGSRKRVTPNFLWFRVVQTDRYLALQLGLPQSCAEAHFDAGCRKDELLPIEKFERQLTIAAGRLMLRNRDSMRDLETVHGIDELLLRASRLMPPEWWLCADVSSTASDEHKMLRETNRCMLQITYYQLLERLHMPFLLLKSDKSEYDYHRMTALMSSREVLSRFVAFRDFLPCRGTFCRGLDFLAFSAGVVICLGHIYARIQQQQQQQQQQQPGRAESTPRHRSVSSYLAHHRLGDQAMLARSLALLEKALDAAPDDRIVAKVAKGFQNLLLMESHVADGTAYMIEPNIEGDEAKADVGYDGSLKDGTLLLRIPHLGTLRVKHMASSPLNGEMQKVATRHTDDNGRTEGRDSSAEGEEEGDQHQVGTCSPPGAAHDVPLDQYMPILDARSVSGRDWSVGDFLLGGDWDLDGLDAAFFDSLFSQSSPC